MWNLLRYEYYKLWSQRMFSISLAVLCAVNLFFLWNGNRQKVAGSSYRALGLTLEQMDYDQRLGYLEEQREQSYGLHQLDYYIQNEYDNPNNSDYDAFSERWKAYGELYTEGGGLTYSDTYTKEYQLLDNAYQQARYVAEFHDRLNEIQNAAQKLLNISIFEQNNYNQKSIEKNARDYEGLEEIEPQFQLQEFWYTVTNYAVTDYILIGMILFCSFFLVRQEQENGILYYLWSMPAGRLKLGIVKWMTFCGSLLFLILLLYGVNFVWCAGIYPIGSLTVPVQSLAYLRDCTLKINVGQYFLIYLGVKFLAACVLGSFLLFCALLGRQIYMAYLPAAGFLAINNILYSAIPTFGRLNLLHYCNLFALLKTNTILAEYQNLYWFGTPITKWKAQFFFGAIAFLLFGGIFLLLFLRKQRVTTSIAWFKLPIPKGIHLPSFLRGSDVIGTEFYKAFFKNGALVVLTLFLLFQGYQIMTYENFMTADEMQNNYYISNLAGPYGERQYKWLLNKQKKFAPIMELSEAYNAGELTAEEYEAKMFPLNNLRSEYSAFRSVVSHLTYMKEHPNAQFINEKGYTKLFGLNNNQNQTDALWAALLCILCCSGAFSIDYSSGMIREIAATPRGRSYTAKAKILVAFVVSVLIVGLISVPHFITVARDYGMTSIFGAAYSLTRFQNLPVVITVSDLIVGYLLVRVMAVFLMALIILWVSNTTKDMMKSIFVSSFLFIVPLFLSIYFTPALRWFTIYPCFHFTAYISMMYQQGWSALGSLLWLFSWGGFSLLAILPFFGTETTLVKFVKEKVLRIG